MDYKVAYEDHQTGYIKIKAKFEVEANTIIQFPTWRPGRYEIGDFIKNVHGFKVMDENQKPIQHKKINKDSWQVENAAGTIYVGYSYYAKDLNAGSTFIDDQQLYMNPVNCLAYIPGKENEACTLKLSIPSDWKIACGLPFKEHHLITDSYHDLVDSPFIASASLQHDSYESHGTTFHLWFQGECKPDWKKLKTDFKKFTDLQMENFGSIPVKGEYAFLFQILPHRAYHGVEHQYSTVIALGPSYDLMGKTYDDLLGVSSHELYHTWNIKNIRPAEMYPYDYSKENFSNLGYVAEGVTTYMGDIYLMQSGVWDEKRYLKELIVNFQRHFDNFGRFNLSVAESSWDTWIDGYVAGAPNRKVSIYNEGAILAFVCDMKIRKNSNNTASLHDVMTDLYTNYAQQGKGYTEKEYQELVEKYADESLEELFSKFFYGTGTYEVIVEEALASIGYELKQGKAEKESWSRLGIKTLVEKENTLIKVIYPGSNSELAGLMIDDEIVAVNRLKIESNLDNWLTYFKDDTLFLTICRTGKMMEIEIPELSRGFYPKYDITEQDTPDKGALLLRKWWVAGQKNKEHV
jgi:predicted metalloprotease with PDZ domain